MVTIEGASIQFYGNIARFRTALKLRLGGMTSVYMDGEAITQSGEPAAACLVKKCIHYSGCIVKSGQRDDGGDVMGVAWGEVEAISTRTRPTKGVMSFYYKVAHFL